MSTISDTVVIFGYTLTDIEKLTRAALRRASHGKSLDPTDRWDYAWHAIVELLYTSSEQPSQWDLIQAGADALTYERNHTWHHHGVAMANPEKESARNFVKYWRGGADVTTDGFSERVAERVALAQVLAVLPWDQYDALASLAVHGAHEPAAAALGISTSTLKHRLKKARTTIKQHWFAPETPRQPIKVDLTQTCKSGHSRTEHGRINNQGKWHCSRCARNRSRLQRLRETAEDAVA